MGKVFMSASKSACTAASNGWQGVLHNIAKDQRARFYSTVDLVNELEKEKREGKAGRIALALTVRCHQRVAPFSRQQAARPA